MLIMTLKCQQKTLDFENSKIYFASLKRQESRDIGLQQLKKDSDSLNHGSHVKLIIGGGDGSIMWVVESLIQYQIDVNKCVIIPLPLGTGNDFSNILGWGKTETSDLLANNYLIIREYIMQWSRGKIVMFDIWEIEFQTFSNGSFQQIVKHNDSSSKVTLKDNEGIVQTNLTKRMSNYFSIGIDARIGLAFDRKRTGSQCGNKCVYCWEGFKKLFLKTQRVNEVITGFSPLKEQSLVDKRHVDVTPFDEPLEDIQTLQPKIEGDPATLICLNINSFSGGVQHIWKNATSKSPLKNKKHTSQTSFSDGQLEFITFDSIIGMINERVYGGNAKKVAQGKGPFQLNFKQSQTDLITHFQIDGEYFQVTNPDKVQIRHYFQLPNGKIKVLARQ